ncbi:MAG: hypothetical protein HDT30_11710 [Clostridiales bacterium]|nr:hypothetical protein [Clostridiales bacterium]
MQKFKKALAFLFSLAMVISLFANVGLEIEASTNNTITVYYNNNSWSQANIHYQQANGTWTNVPGEKMTATSEVSGYKWKATIDLGSNSSTQVCFNDGNNNWDSQNGANYTVSTGTCGIKDGKQEAINIVTPTPTPELFTCDFDMDKTSPQTVGTTVDFIGYTYNMPYHMYNNYAFVVHKQGSDASQDTYIQAYKDNSTTPTSYLGGYKFKEAGIYEVTFRAMQYSGYIATKTKTITINANVVTPTPNAEKILYFNNYYSKWNNVYAYVWNNNADAKVFETVIYDKVAKVYEVKIPGNYKYIIFKNTKDTWDLQTEDLEIPTDYNNYYSPTEAGNKPKGFWNGYCNRAFQCSLDIGLTSPQIVGTSIPLIGRTYDDMPGHRYNSFCFVIHKQGTDESKDKTIHVLSNEAPQYKTQWTPTEPGIYDVSFHAIQYSGYTAVDTKTFVISQNQTQSKTVTIYYANDSYKNAYIHYKVGNGYWTSNSGMQMTRTYDKNGYTWKYVIEVEDENPQITVCFNDGLGNWDSKNGLNYVVNSFSAGIKDGKIDSGV